MGESLFLGGAILSIVNGTLLLWINPRRTVNRAFFLCCGCICLWCTCVTITIRLGHRNPAPVEPLNFWLRASSGVGAFSCWLLWLTKTALINRDSTISTILRKSWPWFIISCVIATLAFTESFIPSTATPEIPERGLGYIAYLFVIAICCAYFLIDALRCERELSGIRKIELRYFVVNAIVACLFVVLAHAASFYFSSGWLRKSGLVIFTLLNCTAVWAICYYRVFDAKQIIFSVGHRLILFGILAGCAVGLSLLLSKLVPSLWSIFLSTIISCAIAAALDKPSRQFVGLDAELILEKPRRMVIAWARQYTDEAQLRESFEKLFREWCQTDRAILIAAQDKRHPLLRFESNEWTDLINISKDGWLTPESLQRKRSVPGTANCLAFMTRNNIGAFLAAPRSDPYPSLVAVFGQKESLRPYTFPDIQTLLALLELMDNILTHTRAAANATQLQKVETASMMSRGLAHDLGNLATPVSSFLVHMESRVSPGTQEAIVLADAKHSIGVMQQYIQESLFFTRDLVLRVESNSARQLLSSVSRICQDRARKLHIEILPDTKDFSFRADPALIQRLLQNLLFNAIDASPIGEKIGISARAADDGSTVLMVHNKGAGIAPDLLERIFEPYFTTKQSGNALRGLGLGLAICRKIVDLHGGSIVAASNVHQGTTFTVILPAEPATPATGQTPQLQPAATDPTTEGSNRHPSGILNFKSQILGT